MKQILFTLLLLCSFWNSGIGQITFQGCNPVLSPQNYNLINTTTTNDAGTIRNTYESSPADFTQSCAAGVCEVRIIWSIANSRWEIQLDNDGPLGTPDYTTAVLYFNTTASFPDPPSLTLGTWTDAGSCGGTGSISTFSGNVQNTVSSGAPEIDIIGNGFSIVDGDVTPSTTDNTNFGNVVFGGSVARTFTISNASGTSALNVTSLVISGANPADFVRSGITFPVNIAAGASTTFTLTFTPGAVGIRNATVTINNNDANEGTYTYAVRGTGVGAPEINILGNGFSIANGDITPSVTDNTNFGNVVFGGSAARTFTISNTGGTSALNVTSIAMSGANSGDFAISGITLPTNIAAGASTTFTLTFTPGAVGIRNATVTINNNDADEGTYTYSVRGTGTADPEINILGNGLSIADGDVTPRVADNTNLGNANIGANVVRTFTLSNAAGTGALSVTSIVLSGANAGDFAIGGITLPTSIAAGATTTFTVTFSPLAVGLRNAALTVNNDDADEGAYTFAIRGNGVGVPEIDIIGNGNSIVDGDLSPSLADDTDYGNVNVGGNNVHTFTIDNSLGTAALDVTTINITGANASDFVVSGIALPANIAAGGTATFQLTFTPSATGLREATITVNNNDADEATYDFAVRGAGVSSIAITEWITNPISNDFTDEWVELFNYGATPVDIQNWTVEDEDVDTDIIITSSFVIPAGGYVILAKNKATFEAQWLNGCPFVNVIEVAGLTLANGTDEIIIKDASNNVVWSVAYKNDDVTGIAAQYTEAPNFTNQVWGSKSSTGVDRTGTDPATGTLGYENNNATADPNVMTSVTGDMGSPFDGTYTPPSKDIVRGDALDFDGANDFVSVGNRSGLDFERTNTFSIESWVQWNSGIGMIVCKMDNLSPFTGYEVFAISGQVQVRLTNSFTVNGINVLTTAGVLADNEWHHVAVSYDGSSSESGLLIYIDGILQTKSVVSDNLTGTIQATAPLQIGARSLGAFFFNGQMDEVRIWNTERTANEIRENMHLNLKNCPLGLVAYYQMNDGAGSATLTDHSGNEYNGTLTNMDPVTDWINSDVNVGNDAVNSSNSQTISVPSGFSTQNFAAANASLRFFQHSGTEDITVTYQAFVPNGITGISATNLIQNPMWTVNKSSSTINLVADYTFTFAPGTFISLNPAKYGLYHRPMNSGGVWTKIAVANAVTNNTVTFGKISLTGQFMVVRESEITVSDVRGKMYEFSGANYIDNAATATNLPTGNAPRTMEAWIKTTQTSIGNIISWGRRSNNQRNTMSVRNNVLGFIGESNDFNGNTVINDGAWHHVAITFDGLTMRLYVDGVLDASSNRSFNTTDQNLRIGTIALPSSGENYEGSLDEVRIWNVARTQEELRENRHLTLKGSEIGLVSYYQFNTDDPIGTAGGVKDGVGTNDGTTVNMTSVSYLASEVPVAGGASDRILIPGPGVYNLPNTDVSIEFGANTPNGEIVVSRLETEKPHGWETIGGDVDDEYFVVNNYGTNASFDALLDLTFDRISYVSPADAALPQASSPLQLFKRSDNAFGATWGTALGGADNATAGTNALISYNAVNNVNSFSQLVIANLGGASDLPVELMKFEAARLSTDEVELVWATATEINNKGFYIERMLETETGFKTIGFVEGKGNSTAIANYQLLDANSFTAVSYYRLRQVDFDGTTSYSQIRAVEGRDNKLEYMDVSIYPNPVQKELNVRFNALPKEVKSAQVMITSIDGKMLYNFTAGVQSYQLLEVEGVGQLSAGIYLLSINFDNEERVVQKFIKE